MKNLLQTLLIVALGGAGIIATLLSGNVIASASAILALALFILIRDVIRAGTRKTAGGFFFDCSRLHAHVTWRWDPKPVRKPALPVVGRDGDLPFAQVNPGGYTPNTGTGDPLPPPPAGHSGVITPNSPTS